LTFDSAKVFSSSEKNYGMPKIIEAVYENGVFKPLEKVDLKEGERVRVIAGNLVERLRKYRVKVDADIVAEFISERR